MTKIMPHDPTKSQVLTSYGPRREDHVASPKDLSSHAGPPAGEDKAEISTRARDLLNLRAAVERGRAALVEAPEVRTGKVAQARERLASGFYNSAEVRDQVAGKLASMFMDHPLF
ncbi:MAG: flagellar biosynthesis anti-sigma factor FlgM [Candidatus Krumholzibacteriia bacterium]